MHDLVAYRWCEVPGIRKRDVVRLHEIRLYVASMRDDHPQLNVLVPVLMGDGSNPYITLSSGPVYRLTKPGRYGKLIAGKLLDNEKDFATPVQGIFSGDPSNDPILKSTFNELYGMTTNTPVRMFNSPMWCRKAKTRRVLSPRNNQAMRYELGVKENDPKKQGRALKEVWDQLADNAYCTGYCSDGFLFDADMIKGGGVVCVPRQYDQPLDISGVCLKSDMLHIIKTQSWRGVKI